MIQLFNTWSNAVNVFFGYPDESGTLQYTLPIAGTNGKIYAPYNSELPVQFIDKVAANPSLPYEV